MNRVGCLSHVDRDCELWLDSEGQLKKEEQANGSWICASPFVQGSSLVIEVLSFYEARKKERQQMSRRGAILILVVVLGSQQPLVVVQPLSEEGEDF